MTRHLLGVPVVAACTATPLFAADYSFNPSVTSTAWLNWSNWVAASTGTAGVAFPGVDLNASSTADGLTSDIATIGSVAFSGSNLGINFNASASNGRGTNSGANGQLSVGAIVLSSSANKDIVIGNSVSTAGTSALLQLNGGTVSGSANTVLANFGGVSATPRTLTLSSYAGGAPQALPMTLQLGAASNVMQTSDFGSIVVAIPIGQANGVTASVIKAGNGILTLSGVNSFSGGLTVNAGTVAVPSSAGLGSTTTVTTIKSGATLSFTGATGLDTSPATRTYALDGGFDTVNVLNANSSVRLSGELSGAGTLVKSGAGTLYLNATNVHLGGTTLAAGRLFVETAGALGSGRLTINGGTIDSNTPGLILDTNNPITIGGTFIFGANNSLDLGNGAVTLSGDRAINTLSTTNARLRIGGAIGGAFPLSKTGTGSLTLAGANTFSGGMTLFSGKLTLANATALGTGTFSVVGGVIDAASTLEITADNSISLDGDFNFAASASLNLGDGAVTLTGTRTITTDLGVSDSTLTVSGVIGESTGASGLIKAGAGTLILDEPNTFTGGITLAAGTLRVADGTRFGAAPASPTQQVTFSGDSTIAFTNTGSVSANRIFAISDGVTATLDTSGFSLTLDNTIAGFGSLKKIGSGTLTLNGPNAYAGTTTISAGVLEIGSTGSLGTGSVINNGTLAFNRSTVQTVGNAISGGGALTQSGAGTIRLTGANTYSGTTTINAGTLQVGNNGTVGTLGSGAVINNGTLSFVRTNSITVANAISGTGSITQAGSNTLVLTGDNNYSGTTTITTGTLQVGSGLTGTLGTGPVVNGGALTFNRSNTLVVGNAISGSGTLTQSGAGTLVLAGGNSYGGLTTVSAGTLQIGNAGLVGTLGTANVANNATLAFNRSNALSVANAISGSGAVRQIGAGSLTLSGPNTYAGGTTISAGTLFANNTVANSSALGSGIVNVDLGGTLSGSGEVHGAGVNVKTGGVITAGGSVGTIGSLTTDNQSWQPSGTYRIKLDNASDGTGTGWDLIAMKALNLSTLSNTAGGKFIIALTNDASGVANFDTTAHKTFTIATFTSVVLPSGANVQDLFALNTAGFAYNATTPEAGSFSLSFTSNAINLEYTESPEPTTTLLFGTGAASLLMSRRRRVDDGLPISAWRAVIRALRVA